MRYELGHRYPESPAAARGIGKWSAAVLPPMPGVHESWRWMVCWPGHYSRAKRMEGTAPCLLAAVESADAFARSVDLRPHGQLTPQEAAALEARTPIGMSTGLQSDPRKGRGFPLPSGGLTEP